MACHTSTVKSSGTTVYIYSDGRIAIEPGTASYCDTVTFTVQVHREVTVDEWRAACDALAAVVKSPAEEQPEGPRIERPLWPRPASRARVSQRHRPATRRIRQPLRERASVCRNRKGRIES
jgi:hypothetical protein